MPRTIPALLLACVLASPAAAQDESARLTYLRLLQQQQPPQPQPPLVLAEGQDLRVYDLRDLAAMLPTQQDGAPAADTLVGTLASSLGAQHRRLLDGVYAVAAPADTHQVLVQNLDRIRQLHGETYQIAIAAYAVDAAGVPQLGAAAPAADGA